jgi:hypothetical protein
MKRDNDLIREILAVAETSCNGDQVITISVAQLAERFPAITQSILNEHIRLLSEKKFLETNEFHFAWSIRRMTWEGHDFLSNAKDQTIWNKSKQLAGHLSFDIFTTIIKDVALSVVRSQI